MTEATAPYDGTTEWQAARLGNVTASRISDIVAKRKDGYPAASRANYLAELVLERLTGVPQDQGYQSEAMLWGIETEHQAREAYEWAQDTHVSLAGFVVHPRIEMAGASPDGFVGSDGLVEVKCPNSKTHLETIESDTIPIRHRQQIDWQLACTGRKWCDFVSYDPRLPEYIQLYVQRVERNEEPIAALEDEVTAFLGELEAKIQWIQERFGNG